MSYNIAVDSAEDDDEDDDDDDLDFVVVYEDDDEDDDDDDDGGYVTLKSTRAIQKGERLYMSYYQDYFCNSFVTAESGIDDDTNKKRHIFDDDDDEEEETKSTRNGSSGSTARTPTPIDNAFYYNTQDLLKDCGFVEQYPQKWVFENNHVPNFNFWNDHDEDDEEEYKRENTIIFTLDVADDSVDDNKEDPLLKVTWLNDVRPDLMMISVMESHIERLNEMETWLYRTVVEEEGNHVLSEHEQDTLLNYYKSLKTALHYAVLSAMDGVNQYTKEELFDVDDDDEEDESYSKIIPFYHDFNKKEDIDTAIPYTCHPKHMRIGRKYTKIHEVQSQYQKIGFRHSEKKDDTCLWLSDWAQTCTSFRQYHEALVHYPASFLKDVKRVAYLGGGDNMILHEILKYPNLELVLGMELDQFVVRYAYMNFGTLPYFDDPRVQWWFGDATKSLLMLPEDYFGSFDLVLIDLQTFVADALRVTPELSVMDTMKLLLKPQIGVISKNEDFPNRAVTDFAKYTVDLEYCDLPQLCRQSITIGSNGVNFLRAEQYNHGIDTIYLKKSLQKESRFNEWYGFRENQLIVGGGQQHSLSQSSTTKEEDNQGKSIANKATSHAVLSIIEVEDLSDGVKHTKKAQMNAISKALNRHGLQVVNTASSDYKDSFGHDIFFVLEHGYIILRQRSAVDNYVAVDMSLWDSVDLMNDLKRDLIESIGGKEDSSSSYKMVTGGINGVQDGGDPYILGSKSASACDAIGSYEGDDSGDVENNVSLAKPALYTIWREMISMIKAKEYPTIVILCGLDGEACSSKDALDGDKDIPARIIAIHSCSGLTETSHHDSLYKCEELMVSKMLNDLPGSSIEGFWIDASVSHAVAKVFFRLVSTVLGKARHDYVIFLQMAAGEFWRENFLSMFKTEISPFAPSKEVKLTIGSAEFGLFSSNDSNFYLHLGDALDKIDEKIGLTSTVNTAESGYAKYVPDFAPKFFNNTSYDNSRAYQQWQTQKAIGFQTIMQFELDAPLSPLDDGETVLYHSDDNIWTGWWVKAKILKRNKDGTYNIQEKDSKSKHKGLSRHYIRPLDFDTKSTPPPVIDVGTRVLIKRRDYWAQGFVSSQNPDGRTYKIRFFEGEGGIREVDIRHLMPQFEAKLDDELPSLTMESIEEAFRDALSVSMGSSNKDSSTELVEPKSYKVGDGGASVAIYRGGNAILTWDGDKHIDVNFYLDDEQDKAVVDKFQQELQSSIPYLVSRSKDQQPRGYGRVVNFASEIDPDKIPIWWKVPSDTN